MIGRHPGETDAELRERLMSLDDVCPVNHVARCTKCGRVTFVEDLGGQCGPNFALDTLCLGTLVECSDHDALLAAYKLGGEDAAVQLLFDGCKHCIYAYLYGSSQHCPEHG